MTPYDAARVQAFVEAIDAATIEFALALVGRQVVRANTLNLVARFERLSPWEALNVLYRLHEKIEAQFKQDREGLTRIAREADDRADAAVALAEEVF